MEENNTHEALMNIGDYLKKDNPEATVKVYGNSALITGITTVDLVTVKTYLPKGFVADYNKKFEILRINKETRSAV